MTDAPEFAVATGEEITKLRAQVAALTAANEALRTELQSLLARDERNTCPHDTTHRGGSIWEICDECGAKWADDQGGKPSWQEPLEWTAARAALERKVL